VIKYTTGMRFVDTNVLLYAIGSVPTKSELARSLLESDDLALSVQVLQEFYVQATRQSKPDRLSHEDALLLIQSFCRFKVQELTVDMVLAALQASKRYAISYWDAAVVEAARVLGCRTLLSEDLNHGQDFGGVRVLNPFR
jgi:predicted nucleic acid-binding protein